MSRALKSGLNLGTPLYLDVGNSVNKGIKGFSTFEEQQAIKFGLRMQCIRRNTGK